MFDVMLPTFRAAPPALPSICDIWAQKQKLLAEVLDYETELRSKGGREQRVQCPNVELNDALLLGDPLSQCLRHMEERRSLGLVFCWFGWLVFFCQTGTICGGERMHHDWGCLFHARTVLLPS